MTFQHAQILKNIAEIIGAKYIGADDFPVLGTNEIHRVRPGDIVFVNHPKYYDKALGSAATVILIDKEVPCPEGKALLISNDPFRDFNTINTYFTKIYNFKEDLKDTEIGENTSIHPSAVIGNGVKVLSSTISDSKIGDFTSVGPYAHIRNNCDLGEHVRIGNFVELKNTNK